jgi:hypothetical protein
MGEVLYTQSFVPLYQVNYRVVLLSSAHQSEAIEKELGLFLGGVYDSEIENERVKSSAEKNNFISVKDIYRNIIAAGYFIAPVIPERIKSGGNRKTRNNFF